MPKKVPAKVVVKSKKSEVKIRKVESTALVDEKVVRGDQSRILKLALGTLAIGLLAGAGVLAYFLYYVEPPQGGFNDQIIVPRREENPETDPAETPVVEAPIVVIKQVKILSTPTGFLNVRKGPGTNFEKIATVTPGSVYELVVEDSAKGWLEIRLDDTKLGWVSKQYAEIE